MRNQTTDNQEEAIAAVRPVGRKLGQCHETDEDNETPGPTVKTQSGARTHHPRSKTATYRLGQH
jgi:hypothetical protein